MSTTNEPTTETEIDTRTDYKYVVVRTDGTHTFDYDTRHEAIGVVARYGGTVVPIAESCLVREHRNPVHLGNQHYGDRQTYPTTHGTTEINRIDIVRMVNGTQQETLESHWTVDCPVCRRTFESDDGAESSRVPLLDEMHACCGTEWFPPSDWVENCEICGTDHRGEYNCEPLTWRDDFDGVEHDYAYAACGWDGPGEDLLGPSGDCPECESPAVQVVSDE